MSLILFRFEIHSIDFNFEIKMQFDKVSNNFIKQEEFNNCFCLG
jgi:hypothetical protein